MMPYLLIVMCVCYLLFLIVVADPNLNDRTFGSYPRLKTTRVFLAVPASLLVAAGALRWNVGSDYGNYIRNFDLYIRDIGSDIRNFNEPGINLLAWISSKLSDDPALYLVFASILTQALILATVFKRSVSIPFSLLLFIFLGTWHTSFNIVKQFIACAIIFAGHKYILERRFPNYLLIVCIASMFHVSALLMIFIYWVPLNRMRLRNILALVAVVVIIIYSEERIFEFILFFDVGFSVTEYAVTSVDPLRVAVSILPAFLIFLYGRTVGSGDGWFYVNMTLVAAAISVASSWSIHLSRVTVYFSVFLLIALPRMTDFKDRTLTLIFRGILLILYFIVWYVDISTSDDLNNFLFLWDR